MLKRKTIALTLHTLKIFAHLAKVIKSSYMKLTQIGFQ